MNISKRQHYVWRSYLNSWAAENLIWCNRNGVIFHSQLMNVGQEKFFYEVMNMNDEEISFIRLIGNSNNRPEMNGLIDDIINYFRTPALIENFLTSINIPDQESWNLHREAKVNAHEHIHSSLESESRIILDKLLDNNISVMDNETDKYNFIQYISFQYLRTKKQKNRIINMKLNLPHNINEKINIINVWGPISVALSYQLAMGVIGHRKPFKLKILNNTTNINFITGDQPVINMRAVGKQPSTEVHDLDIYHPLSPKIAIILSPDITENRAKNVNDPDVIKEFNNMIVSESLEQTYGSVKNDVDRSSPN
jgi:hypothetical protein